MVTGISALEVEKAQRRGPAGAAASALGVVRSAGSLGQIVRFSWHFVQMAIAMWIGMFIGMAPPLFSLVSRSPEGSALEMTVAMVIPMAAWMRIRGHSWERTAEMSGAMSVPVVLLAAGSLIGLLPHTAALVGMNIFMWVGMLGAMLFRWSEYTQHHHGHGTQRKAAS